MSKLVLAGALALLLGTVAVAGCYNPDIKDGGFGCAEAGKLCPDGFVCSMQDHLCHRNGAPPVDAATCTEPAVTPLCQAPAFSGACDPACQVGCNCGRCNVSPAGAAICTTVGTKKLGEVCALGANDNCAPGHICQQEACGNNFGRCYRLCNDDTQCSNGLCRSAINDASGNATIYKTCLLAPQTCNPLDNTGCQSPLNCYMNAPNTFCDCPHGQPGALGAPCLLYNDCQPGLICIIGVSGATGPHCQTICNTANPICPTGRTCMGTGPYGYCG